MEGADGNRGNFKFPARMNGFSSDLLRKFTKKSSDYPYGNEEEEEEEDEEIELSLGLSMNGRFGVDPARKKLKRSSSISNLVFTVGAADNNGTIHHARGLEFDVYAPLARTRSLPTETEEEWRRRKELQSMRRMEARRKRMEKLKNVRMVKDKENCFQDVKNGLHEVVANGSAINGQRLENAILHGFDNGNLISSPQGSIESLRSGSSGVSDLIEGAIHNPEVPPSSLESSHEQGEHEPAGRDAGRDAKGTGKLLKNAMLDMPYVSTKGNGPNGRKIEGFLYRYKKGEEVRIVCVCHGMFFTPKEFVEHGGGGDVEQPLKHIVVNPFPLL